MIRVLVADDHLMVRQGLRQLMAVGADIEVIAEAADGDEAVARYRECRPDVAIVDLRMPRRDGIAVIAALKSEFPQGRFIALSNCQGDEDVFRALEAGADAYLFKDVGPQQLLDAIRAVQAGRQYLAPDLAARVVERARRPSLSPREMEVLLLMSKGVDNRQIADALGISVETVRDHVTHILRKLDVENRTEAVTVALQTGLLHLD